MKVAVFLAAVLLSVVAVAHLLRIIFGVALIVGGATISMWPSGVAVLVAGGLSFALWRELIGSG